MEKERREGEMNERRGGYKREGDWTQFGGIL